MARPILEIDLDDSAFTRFLDMFHHYEDELKTLPQHWQASGKEIATHKTSFEKINAEIAKTSNASSGMALAQAGSDKLFDSAAVSLGLLSTHGKHFAANIHQSTMSLLKWTKLTSVFSGILGAGGLYGINRMATSAAGQRTSAMGLGVSYGEQASFLTNFRALGNPEGILKGFSDALSTPVGKAQIAHLIGHRPTGDAAETAAEALPKFKEFVDKTPDAQLGPLLKTFGYDKLGLGVEQAKAIRGMSREEIEGRARDYREGKTSALALDPATAKKWTEFTTQMERASYQLENVFAKDLVQLTPGLTHLSDSFVHLVDNLLKDGSPIKGWIDTLGAGIDKLVDAIGEKSFQQNVSKFVRDSGDAVRLVESAIAAAPGGVAALIGMYLAGKLGGRTAVAFGEALGAVSGLGLGTVAAVGALGATVYPQPLNADEDERARQQKFGTTPRPTGHPATKTLGQEDAVATPNQNERAATSGTGARTQTPGGPGSKPTTGRADSLSTSGFVDSEGLPTITARGGGAPKAFIAHWTGGGGTIESVQQTLKERGLGVQYIMDREGHIKATGDESKWGTPLGKSLGLSSANTVGMEIIADPTNPTHPLPYTSAQIASFKKFMQDHYPDTPVYGHGEVQSSKQLGEGFEPAEAVRKERASRKPQAALGRHPVDVALMHRKPSVEIAMEGHHGEWAVA